VAASGGAAGTFGFVLGGGVERFDEPPRGGPYFRSPCADEQLANVVRVGQGDLGKSGALVWAELQDEPARFAHLLEAAHELELFWFDDWRGR
jgi:hypothetical protein